MSTIMISELEVQKQMPMILVTYPIILLATTDPHPEEIVGLLSFTQDLDRVVLLQQVAT